LICYLKKSPPTMVLWFIGITTLSTIISLQPNNEFICHCCRPRFLNNTNVNHVASSLLVLHYSLQKNMYIITHLCAAFTIKIHFISFSSFDHVGVVPFLCFISAMWIPFVSPQHHVYLLLLFLFFLF